MDKITIDDVAKISNVSRATVSRVINNKGYVATDTRLKIEKVIKETSFIPNAIARSLKTTTRSVGVVSLDITNPYFTEIICTIEKKLRDNQYLMYLLNSDNNRANEEKALLDLFSKRVDGIILLSIIHGNKSHIINIAKRNIAVVIVEGFVDCIDSINTNNKSGAKAAVEYLIKCGHSKIAYCANTLDIESFKNRFVVYKSVMKKHFNKINAEYFFIGKDYINQFDNQMMGNNPPSAIFCTNDSHALKIYDYCYQKKINIPNDISIIGFDNLSISKLVNPPLSTISIPVDYMGELAAKLLLDKMEKSSNISENVNIEISTSLVIRDSILNISK